jgi:hypothetical protein
VRWWIKRIDGTLEVLLLQTLMTASNPQRTMEDHRRWSDQEALVGDHEEDEEVCVVDLREEGYAGCERGRIFGSLSVAGAGDCVEAHSSSVSSFW